MKYLASLLIVTVLGFFNPFLVHAADTHSATLVAASSQYFTAADSASLSVTGDMTVEGWIKINSRIGGSDSFVSKYEYTGDQRSWYIYFDQNTGVITLGIFESGTTGTDTVFSAITMNTGTWYHWAFAYTAASHSVTLYVDGTAVETKDTIRTSIFNGTAKVALGNRNPDNDPTAELDGKLDEVRIWNTVRSATDINNNKCVQIDSATGLVASWHLDNALTDSSGNSNTLTNVNSATFTTDVPSCLVPATATVDTTYFELTE